MRRYTTPTMAMVIEKPEVADATAIYVTFKQGSVLLTLSDGITVTPTETGVQLEVELTQLQTAGFEPGRAQIQVNWLEESGKRFATEIAYINITDNILAQTISGGADV